MKRVETKKKGMGEKKSECEERSEKMMRCVFESGDF